MRPSAILVLTLASAQIFAAIVASLYFALPILDPASSPGQSVVWPALLFCLATVVAGVVLAVKRNLTACRAVVLWDLIAALFVLVVALVSHPNQELLILAAGSVMVFVVLITVPSAVLMVVIGVLQTIVGILAFLYMGAYIFAGAAYLGVGPGAGPVLLFCLAGAIAGVALVAKQNVAACRGVALWNLVLGICFLLAVFGRHPHPVRLIPAAAFLITFIVLIVPLVPCLPAHPSHLAVGANSSG